MLDQEMASIMHFVLEQAGGPTPYYWEVPEGFMMPSVFFPTPMVTFAGDTTTAYRVAFSWFIKVFARSTPEAQALGFKVLESIQARRNEIPMVDQDGVPGEEILRLGDPELRPPEASGVSQLTITWDSRRPYIVEETSLIQTVDLQLRVKEAYHSAIRQFEGGETVNE